VSTEAEATRGWATTAIMHSALFLDGSGGQREICPFKVTVLGAPPWGDKLRHLLNKKYEVVADWKEGVRSDTLLSAPMGWRVGDNAEMAPKRSSDLVGKSQPQKLPLSWPTHAIHPTIQLCSSYALNSPTSSHLRIESR